MQGDARRFGFCSSAGEARLERTSSCFWPVRQTSVAGFGIGDTREVRPKTHVFPQSVAKSNEIDRRLRIGLGNSGDIGYEFVFETPGRALRLTISIIRILAYLILKILIGRNITPPASAAAGSSGRRDRERGYFALRASRRGERDPGWSGNANGSKSNRVNARLFHRHPDSTREPACA